MRKIEFIESYVVKDGDYEWNDNHGELIRCQNCKYWQDQEYGVVEIPVCERLAEKYTRQQPGVIIPMGAKDYCSKAEKKGEGKE